MKLYGDLETFSEVPIKNGTFSYAAGAEILLFAWALDDGPISVWDLTAQALMPQELKNALANPDILKIFHNLQFDRTVLRESIGIDLPIEQCRCTMARALAHGLPGGLDILCDIFAVPVDKAKSKEGYKLVRQFCVPKPANQKLRRHTSATHPEEWRKFIDYARLDIEAMRVLDRKLPEWNYGGAELEFWWLDQRINQRGVAVDVDLAHAAIRAVDRAQKKLEARTGELTEDVVRSTTQRDAMLEHILETYGVTLPDLTMSTVERRLEDPDLPLELKELLTIRLQASSTSTAKYAKLIKGVSRDGRLKGTLQFCGAARTGRAAGRLMQLQNLPRPNLKNEVIDFGIEALKADSEDLFFDDVMELTRNTIRGCLVSPPGRKLVISDLANIEGRVLPWLAGEKWKLDAFRDYDAGTGTDLYKLAYARAFRIKPEEVSSLQRQIGKVMELACFGPCTLVLTDKGVKAITEVLTSDLLWDGVEWVKHYGVVPKSARRVVDVAGIEVTPDHLVLIGQTWKPVWHIVLSGKFRRLALAKSLENLPSSVLNSVLEAASSVYRYPALVALLRTTFSIIICGKVALHVVITALKSKLVIGVKNFTGMMTLYQIKNIVPVCSTEYRHASTDATTLMTKDIQTTEEEVLKYTLLGCRVEKNFYDILLRWTDGISRRWSLIGVTWTKVMSPAICGLLQKQKIKVIVEKFKYFKNGLQSWKIVYDIAHAGPRNRFTVISSEGPLIVHNCGYGGGVGAFMTMSAAYNLNLEQMAAGAINDIAPAIRQEAEKSWEWAVKEKRTLGLTKQVYVVCDSFKRMWRNAHPKIVKLWENLDISAKEAIHTGGAYCNNLKFIFEKNWLRIVLPSGRAVCYPGARYDEKQISYLGVSQYSRKWERIYTYAGKWAENITQAVARDAMFYAMPAIEKAGYRIVAHVHDEVITEAPDTAEFNANRLSKLLATNPSWALGLPLAASGFESYRYKKE